ncbi:MAG TPA: hypothetical protein VLQ67_14665, partial [Arachnia sp.]|nr:hypothetical protein [Arachnia sp.]
MKITVAPQRHAGLVADNRTHFLLADAALEAKVGFADGSSRSFAGVKGPGPGTFVVELQPGDFPPSVVATFVDLTYTVPVTLGGTRFTALRIVQRLIASAPAEGDPPGYRFAPGGWVDAHGRLRISNLLVHPLVGAGGVAAGRVEVNTLMLDITDGWWALHADNPVYELYKEVTRDAPLAMRVLAHTAGVPLIWHAVIPKHLVAATAVSPHIFLQPSDNREGQNLPDDEKYLTKNGDYFKSDGRALIKYLMPPVPDVDVARLRSQFDTVTYWRNVLCILRIGEGKRKGQVTPMQWSIPAGLQRAFEHRGDAKPAQLLLVPQRIGLASSSASGSYGAAVTGHVRRTTDAIMGLIQTNTALTLHGGDTLLTRDKLVYSGFSESGYDLWNVGKELGEHLKAIVAIEPQNLNSVQNDYRPKKKVDGGNAAEGETAPKPERVGPPPAVGKDVIPGLLKRGVRVYIIGRHHRQYGPQVPAHPLLVKLPKDPAKVFAYPPSAAANDFVKYRVQRLLDPASDTLMPDDEREILDELAARGLSGEKALAAILVDEANADRSVVDGLQRWYSHQFALSGGDELTPDPAAIYGTPVEYRTWFQ